MIGLLFAAQIMSVNCIVEPPKNVVVSGETATVHKIGLPPEMNKWAFSLALRDGKDSVDVEMDWPGDPIRVGRALAAFSIGPHDYSFISLHPRPCLFTMAACIFMYTVSEQADGSADILIQPAALSSDGDRSKPFQAFMQGRCTPAGKSK
jgi:hypothetical protein